MCEELLGGTKTKQGKVDLGKMKDNKVKVRSYLSP